MSLHAVGMNEVDARRFSLVGEKCPLERETGFEPATSTLARSHSTTELFPLLTSYVMEKVRFVSTVDGSVEMIEPKVQESFPVHNEMSWCILSRFLIFETPEGDQR